MSAAIVGGNKTRDGGLTITSGGSSGATTGVNENGTVYSVKVEASGQSMNETGDWIGNGTYPDSKVSFQGRVEASTPCHTLAHNVNKTGNDYVLNIETVNDLNESSPPGEACPQVITGLEYDAEFEAEPGFQLEVRHDNETIETFSDRVVEKEPETFLDKILELIGL